MKKEVIEKIKSLQKKAEEEAQSAVDSIYGKYSNEMNSLLQKLIPDNHRLINFNGMSWIEDAKGNQVSFGKAWGRFRDDEDSEDLEEISYLQYADKLYGRFDIQQEIRHSELTSQPN